MSEEKKTQTQKKDGKARGACPSSDRMEKLAQAVEKVRVSVASNVAIFCEEAANLTERAKQRLASEPEGKPQVKKATPKKTAPKKKAAPKRIVVRVPKNENPVVESVEPIEGETAEVVHEKKKKKSGKGLGIKYLGGFLLSKMARGGALSLRFKADEVNRLNVFPVPDGDTGDNMRMTIESGIAAIENLDSDDLAEVMKVLSHGMLLGARGNSGVILSQFFAGTAKGFEGIEKADPASLGYALELGVKQAYASVMTPTEGTILTVAREAVEYAVARITPESTIRTFFADLVKEMHASVERTPEILAALKEADVVDSGGAGLFYIMDGFNRVLNGEEIEAGEDSTVGVSPAAPAVDPVSFDAFGVDSVMTYGYCTELLVRLQSSKGDVDAFDVEALKDFLATLGDSIVAFKTDSVVKVHVHTLTPEKVLEHLRIYGEFLAVKIENMSLQHSSSEIYASEEATPKEEAPLVRKKYGAVAVCIGEGIEALYRDMGCDEIVEGGQTQNPSTNDFLDAFSRVNAEHIFAFPNNGNILMAAQQAAELYTDATVHVIPSKNIGTGYVALSTADFDNPDPAAIEAGMLEAMKHVTAGYVSPSIRDAEINGVHIEKGDTIGIIEKEIVVSRRDRLEAASALAERIMGEDKFMLTVFAGKDADSEEEAQLEARLHEVCPDAEIYFVDGGQDIYPYIFVAE
ncbi:MAG: DAK2 domain-containing protein [Ruminococcaceae bacterium]|nr:DAK2 domain-containing protein [Oscillospiraceae bacterium]